MQCPACGSSEDLTFDWTGVTSIRVESGRVTGVTVGGVLGAYPDQMLCGECGTETTFAYEADGDPPPAAMVVCEAADAQLPERLVRQLNDGVDLYTAPIRDGAR